MRTQFSQAVVPFLLVSSVLSGCASTSSTGDAALNQRNWPICSAIGALAGGGLGAIESSAWAGGGAAIGALFGGLICYAQDGDEDADGVHDRRDTCPDTPANTQVNPNGCPLPSYPSTPAVEPVVQPQDEVIVLSDLGKVLFAFNSAELTADAKELLAGISQRLVDGSVLEVMVKGHTDSVGSDAYNDKLSLRRAESVAAYLVSQGVAADKVKTAGLGESQPLADNATDDGRAQNRRVEIFVDR
ncbi:MAG: OmpA family protein [Pseudomonas sp.]|jgi:outer membrane protein OmpA-like peptidoglycan-associated protein|uniref:OmpA family protein n=1 Tax=Pseudomonas sp. TaxID=306 RepID=UPI001D356057|nr:OmpA family protein [Pseudomonas sp.]MBX9712456.1 OmpA family protein [Pseudomonadaceae bacterium]